MKRRAAADNDSGLAKWIGGEINHDSADFQPEVACARLGPRQDAADQLCSAEGSTRTAREVLGE